MGPLAKGVIALACVLGGAALGMYFRGRLPDEYKGADTKEVVRLVMGLVVTTVALALGLLVGSAKSFYDTQNAEMAQIAADYIMLDRILANYGPESAEARADLRAVLARQVGGSGPGAQNKTYMEIRSGAEVGEFLFDRIARLSPKDEDQRYYKNQCMNLGIKLGEMRWLMYEQNAVPFPGLLLVMLVGWLVLLFVSFGVFAPRNTLVLAGIFASALVVCGAILLILALNRPRGLLIRVSDAPLRAAMEQLER